VQELELQLTTKINEEFDRAVQHKQLRYAPAPVAPVAAVAGGGVNMEELVQLADTLQWVKQQQQQHQ